TPKASQERIEAWLWSGSVIAVGAFGCDRTQGIVEQRLHIGGNAKHGKMLRSKELLVAHVGKELKQEVIKPAGIKESDRLEVQAKLEPGENLDDLLQGAKAANALMVSVRTDQRCDFALFVVGEASGEFAPCR